MAQDTSTPNLLEQLLQKHPEHFGALLSQAEKYELQIIYTRIDSDSGKRNFQSFHYGVNDKTYFYPASSIKMFAAFLALEKLNQLNIIGLDMHSPMRSGRGRAPQTSAYRDSTAENGLASIAHYIKQVFLVSDNNAFNRLYEFLGQAYFNEALRKKGYNKTRIIHRLGSEGAPFDYQANQYTNPVSFYHNDSLIYHQGEVFSETANELSLENEIKGKGYQKNGVIIKEAFDFRKKNFMALEDMHNMLKAVLFPTAVDEKQRFDLTEKDYQFLYKQMGMRPRESRFPKYDKPDGYVKFFLYGGTAEKIPAHIRIFNKVGWAYGYLTDVAYIVDLKNEVEFMVAANIHVNDNEIYNDNKYEYESIGLPFFTRLGEVLYEYELQQQGKTKPDLRAFDLFSTEK